VKGALRPSNTKRLYMDEIEKHRKRRNTYNRKVKRKKRLCCYFVWPLSFNPSDLGGPTRSIKLQPA